MKKDNNIIANFVSIIFSPENVIPISLIVLITETYSGEVKYVWILLIVLLNFLFNYIWLYYLYMLGFEIDRPLEDLSVRKSRLLALLPQILILFFELSLSNLYGGNQPFHAGVILFLVGGLLFSFITFYWKISAHTSATAVLFTILATIISPWFWLCFLFSPFIYLSRKKLHRHTDNQLIIGNILGVIVTAIIFKLCHII